MYNVYTVCPSRFLLIAMCYPCGRKKKRKQKIKITFLVAIPFSIIDSLKKFCLGPGGIRMWKTQLEYYLFIYFMGRDIAIIGKRLCRPPCTDVVS